MAIGRDTEITWYGHGTWGLRSPGGVRILLDPFLAGNPRCPEELKQPDADVILVTHGHGDHISDLLDVARRTGAPVLAPLEVADWVASEGVENVVGFNQGGTVEQRGIRFTMTRAEHTGSIDTPDGRVLYGGEPKGYIVTFENGFRVYASGDTDVFAGMALLREMYAPELAILSIGDHFTMGPFGAAHAVRLLGVRHVLPGHWGTFPALTGTPGALREELGRLGVEANVHDLEPGGTLR